MDLPDPIFIRTLLRFTSQIKIDISISLLFSAIACIHSDHEFFHHRPALSFGICLCLAVASDSECICHVKFFCKYFTSHSDSIAHVYPLLEVELSCPMFVSQVVFYCYTIYSQYYMTCRFSQRAIYLFFVAPQEQL